MSRAAATDEAARRPWGRRAVLIAVGAITVLLVGAAVGWSGARVFAPPAPVSDDVYTIATVEQGTVSGRIAVNVQALWTTLPAATNPASGTVTSVAATTAAVIEPGAVLYSVDLRPVIALQGAVPAFRSLTAGAVGEDVAQLQRFLAAAGHLAGTPDGRFGATTTSAVRSWQRDAGLDVDGTVDLGEVVFVEELPARVVADDEIVARGASLAGGEPAVLAVDDVPEFTIPVTANQAAAIAEGTRVEITAPDGEGWEAWVSGQRNAEDGGVDLLLTGRDDGPICGDSCEQIPLGGGSLLPSRAITAETVEGLVVPSAALRTLADGSTVLVGVDGEEHPVTVLSGARGLSAVSGVEAGLRVRAPADAE